MMVLMVLMVLMVSVVVVIALPPSPPPSSPPPSSAWPWSVVAVWWCLRPRPCGPCCAKIPDCLRTRRVCVLRVDGRRRWVPVGAIRCARVRNEEETKDCVVVFWPSPKQGWETAGQRHKNHITIACLSWACYGVVYLQRPP